MLKPTYRPALADGQASSLPPPWTEHKAPSGHTYYYNPETKKSTYQRPTAEPSYIAPPVPPQNPEPIHYNPNDVPAVQTLFNPFNSFAPQTQFNHRGGDFHRRGNLGDSRHSQHARNDRPKTKHEIPGCAPWLLVKTRLGRRFVHNPETKESFWKVPQDLISGLVEFDIQERERRENASKQASEIPETSVGQGKSENKVEVEAEGHAGLGNSSTIELNDGVAKQEDGESDEYEEIEVTDDCEEDDAEEEQQSPKRQKLNDEGEEEDEEQEVTGFPQSVELGEEDMAYQLAQMGADYELDAGEYGAEDYDGQWEEGAEGLPITAEEASASFKDILDDYNVDPFTTWESISADSRIVEDDRYTFLPNMKARREAFAEWSATRIQELKQLKTQQVKQNPRIPYLAFVEKHATPKLFWPEFRRKHKREPELKDSGLSDKEREKLYREHITRTTKISESTLKRDLESLLVSIPPSPRWNRSISLGGVLPPMLLTDLRFISLKPDVRDQICKEFIAKLPGPDEVPAVEPSESDLQKAKERDKREQALTNRHKEVDDAKREQKKQLLYGQRRLRDEEIELDRAMKVSKEGLLGNLES